MAVISVNQYHKRQFGGAAPYGNYTSLYFALLTNAAGAVIGADSEDAIASGDVVVLGSLPSGMRLEDASAFVKTGMSASITGSLGFRYKDGVDDPDVPQDDAYFFEAGDMAAEERIRANTNKLVILPKDAELILTTGGAASAQESEVEFLIQGELTGPL